MKNFMLLVLGYNLLLSEATKVSVSREGGYTGLIIAISSNVEEDETILKNLKELIINTSAALDTATRGAMYFEEVTISLPSSWSHKPDYDRTVKDNFRDADIKIDDDSFSVEPRTTQSGGCGDPGKYIQMSPDYLRELKNPMITKAVGYPEKRLVKEWAKFRYGVFDESVQEEDGINKRYYREKNGDIMPTACSAEIALTGYHVDQFNNPCDPEVTPEKCYYEVDEHYLNVSASLMYSSSLKSVDTFCDNTAERKHNHMAKNKHNQMCKYKSTWEVITSHKDFQVRSVPTVKEVRDTKPNFRIVRTTDGGARVVMVFDISGSMKGVPIQLLTQTAKGYILDSVPEGTELGIVKFGTRSSIAAPMTKVDENNRKILADKVPKLADGGGTAIGRGLLTAVDTLKANNGQVEGSIILLITDGEETDVPLIETVIPSLIEAGVVVSSIAYGEKATVKLEELATKTDGTTTIFRNITNEEANTIELNQQIMEATTLHTDVNFQPVQLTDERVVLKNTETIDSVFLEPELGKNTVFTFSMGHDIGVLVELEDSKVKVYNWHSPEYKIDPTSKIITFRFTEAETGIWKFTLRRPNDQTTHTDFSLASEPKDVKKQPVRVNSWLDALEVSPPNSPKAIAMVTKSGKPVLNVTVEAYITGPNYFHEVVVLQDDGKGPDTNRNDGMYSGYITQFRGNGRYSVRAKITGNKNAVLKRPEKSKIKINKRIGRSVDNVTEANEDYEVIEDDDEDIIRDPSLVHLQRIQNTGIFRLTNWKEDLNDQIAPSRVSDLEVLETTWKQDGNVSVTLRWTIAGDDLDDGNASAVDLRFSNDFDSLLNDFENQLILNEALLLNGTLEPDVSGELTTITVSMPLEYLTLTDQMVNSTASNSTQGKLEDKTFDTEDKTTLFFALRYLDENNNTADVSNIAAALFLKEPLPEVPTTVNTFLVEDQSTTVDTFFAEDNKGSGSKTNTPRSVIIIAVIISLVAVVAFLAAAVYCLRCRKKYQFVATEAF